MVQPPKPNNQILKPNQQVGRYKIVRKLSSGGFGVVYLAQRDDGHLVAIKEFLPSVISCRPQGSGPKIKCETEYDLTRFQDGLKAFFREADMLAQVHNSRIIPIWDVFKENGTAYFAMPLEKGGTLQAWLRNSHVPLSESDLRSIFVEACKGVEVLHSKGLFHLDIKPSNLWVRPDRSVLVLDLGASRWEDEEVKSSQMARTPGFAAPEQHSQFKNYTVSALTDVYGLSASLLSCLLQGPPTPAPQRKAVDDSIVFQKIGQASSDMLRLIGKGMSLTPSFRHKSVAALRNDLERLPRLASSERWPEHLSSAHWVLPEDA